MLFCNVQNGQTDVVEVTLMQLPSSQRHWLCCSDVSNPCLDTAPVIMTRLGWPIKWLWAFR